MERKIFIPPVLLCIIDYVDLQTLLNLRSVSRSINSLISSYESSIAKSIASSLCPWCDNDTFATYPPSALHHLAYYIRLNIAHDLATKAVASTPLPIHHGISPDDALGDEIRYKVQQGFMTMSRLSQICKEVPQNPPDASMSRLKNPFGRLARGLSSAQNAIEKEILNRWLAYMDTCCRDDVVDLNVALFCLQAKTKSDHQATESYASMWNDVKADTEIEAIQWMIYHLVRKGLRFIDRLWSDDPPVAQRAKRMMQAEMTVRPAKLIALERSTFDQLRRVGDVVAPIFPSAGTEALSYCISTFVYRIAPCHRGMPRDQLLELRLNVAAQEAMSGRRIDVSSLTKGRWRRKAV
ncbi:MAG: hypothetical protein Q9185_005743 [Variospora sp. 1 TL-2023]